MKVPFTDLSFTTDRIKAEYLAAAEKLLAKGGFILGEEVEEFEAKWAEVTSVKYAVGVSNGADAIYLALMALGVGPGDEVITQGTAYNASVTPILRLGATARFADIRPDTLTIDPQKIEPLITPKTKAILPVHLYGQPGDMQAVMAIARARHVAVVEDCAQAHGALWRGKKAGAWGDAGAFSFYPTKNLGAFGDAGAVVTSRPDIKEKIKAMRNLGEVAKNDHQYLGFNMRLDPMQAICLTLKLPHLQEAIRLRMEAGKRYDRLLEEANIPVRPAARLGGATHVYHLYVAQALRHDREMIRRELADRGVETAIHYPLPVYRQPFWTARRLPHDPCPVSDQVLARSFSLPMYAGITPEAQEYVVAMLKEILCQAKLGTK